MEEFEKEYEKVKLSPYDYICNYAEHLYPKTGRKVFEILSLMPVSLIIPDIPYDNKSIRSNMHCLFLAPSGSGKTSIAKLYGKFAFNPLEVESITPAALENNLDESEVISLIVGDFARLGRDQQIVKILEGVLGEEKSVSRETMRSKIKRDAECVALICGVASDLRFYILNGLIFRTIPVLLGHSKEDHSDIGEHIIGKMGTKNNDSDIKEQVIKKYYLELAQIQEEKTPKHELYVSGYAIEKEYRDKILKVWQSMTGKIVNDIGFNWFRELQESMRVMIAHAFLNIHNRKIVDTILHPNEEDYKVALKTMKNNIIFKYRLIRSESMARGVKDAKEFNRIIRSKEVAEEYKNILPHLVKFNK